jgi:hypothetical protein
MFRRIVTAVLTLTVWLRTGDVIGQQTLKTQSGDNARLTQPWHRTRFGVPSKHPLRLRTLVLFFLCRRGR